MPAIKTAISIERDLFQEMDRLSRKLRIPRSRLFARAVQEFLQRQQSDRLLEQINRAYRKPESAEEKAVRSAAAHSFQRLIKDSW